MVQPRLKSKTLTSALATFFLFFLLLWRCVLSDNELVDYEAAYLKKLRKAIFPAPSNWFTATNMCDWSRVICTDGVNGRTVVDINLSSMSLNGTLPSGLNNALLNLKTLDLGNNSLTGPLPSFAGLSLLQELHLELNNFTSVPHGCFQGLKSLQQFSFTSNTNLEPWTFPADLTDSIELRILDLGATNLAGSLPDTFDSFPDLQILELSDNNLTGLLPKSLAKLLKLRSLYLNDQKLSGKIEFLSSMTQLKYVWLQGNAFEGPIPDLSNCTNLAELYLDNNRLTGAVPPSLINLSYLEEVFLANNSLQGPMPAFNKNVDTIILEGNGFCLKHPGPCDYRVTTLLQVAEAFGYPFQLARTWRGNDPCDRWSFITCDIQGKIRTVNLTNLNLTGTISPAFGNLSDLRELHLSGNNLSGSIPESLTTLSQLKILDVSNNNLSGIIPTFSSSITLNTTNNHGLVDRSSPPKASPPHPSTPPPSPTNRARLTASRTTPLWIKLGAGAAGSVVGIIVIFGVIVFNRKKPLGLVQKIVLRRKRKHVDHYVENLIKSYSSLSLKRYTYKEVKKMTKLFSEKLGEGGYGIVYKASLADGQQVAVKILKESKGSVEEFIDEVFIISRTSHMNIVSLLGFCYEKNKRALVYEFMHNDSLNKFTYKKESSNGLYNLDWNTLYQISIGIARGLEYLHRGCNTKILHLDIKPQNILLDEHFHPKIADFGLAKICKKDQSIVSILGTRGTSGYIAPEVFSRTYGGVSHKSDVYSYGMLILEIIGGRHNYYESKESHTSELCFPDWIYKDLEKGNVPTRCLLDKEEENGMVMKMTLVSLWCIQPNPLDRPSMGKVIDMLEGSLESIPYPPKPVLFSPERLVSQYSDISYSNEHETSSTTTEEIDLEKGLM
ncbi:receptor protein kinase TMK1-like [Arachis duranensis]|uniref:non-specific serine/threonine protein kinase n=1 Tax=Arachis duranensis TaxID=130453 RepID=A0A6P4C0Y6_ARADU|nr:receptor protein kinase TMK1-like [Arachis duranensis]